MIRTSFRLPIATIQRLDAIAAELQKRHIGKITRADVLRMLIQNGLTHLEPPGKKGQLGAEPSAAKTPARSGSSTAAAKRREPKR